MCKKDRPYSSLLRGLGQAARRQSRSVLAAVCTLAMLVAAPAAQPQSARTIKLVVPVPPGGAGDILARQLAEQITRTRGVTLMVVNRPGAASIIGTESVAHAAPDGDTLLITAPYLLIGPQIQKVSYDPLTSLAPICYLVSSPGLIVVNAASPYRTLAELLAAARARPGELSLASVGPATAHHLGIERLKHAANVDITYAPYGGGGPAINAVLGGHVTAVFAEYAPLAAHIRSGALRPLATSASARIAPLPDLPTIAESGFKDYEVDFWWSLFAPAKTPDPTLAQLADWFTAALQAPELKAKLVAQGFSPVGQCGGDFAALLRRQYDEYGRIIRETGIKAD